jgi:hypothetical protein
MSRFTNTLSRVRVAAPCQSDWNEMRGDERVRFCHLCSLNVYNLSAMTRREAERLVTGAEGRLCIRFYRRADGTILTQSCPVGLRALKRRVTRVGSATFAAIISFLVGVGVAPEQKHSEPASPSVEYSAPVAPEPEYTEMAGGGYVEPLGAPLAPLGVLASIIFAFGYPLAKLRRRRDEERSKELHIYRG